MLAAMIDDVVRPAIPGDNPPLLTLERSCPQGTRLQIWSEREDYFFRSALYANHHTLVAVDPTQRRLFGVMAATLKEVQVDGRPLRAAYFYDLRVHPDYRRTVLGRHMLGVWNEMERWAGRQGAHLIYGLIKGDNEAMLGMRRRRAGYRLAGRQLIVSRPLTRPRRLRLVPEEVDLARDSGRIVARLPRAYSLLRPLLAAAGRLVPVPRIPRPGEPIRYCHVFNHLAEGPRGRELLRFAGNRAGAEGAVLLTSAFDPSDRFLPHFARGAINRIEFQLGVRALRPGVPETLGPLYPDVRDMD